MSVVRYRIPDRWIHYDKLALLDELVEAKSVIRALTSIPYEKRWVDKLQQMQLKLEVAGTSRIEGADFTGDELEAALHESPQRLSTRSQRQARAALETYKWIASIPEDRPITKDLLIEIHRRIVTGADDDHCAPGELRKQNHNVNFGTPSHRGCEGGDDCGRAFENLMDAIQRGFRSHDSLLQALAAHYHLAAMHPFGDGNGRTARALEALMLQRAGLREIAFIPMSNYYYDEKPAYLAALAEVRALEYDLTPFLKFALRGVTLQAKRLTDAIRLQVSKELFRGLVHDLFNRLQSKRKRVIADRQVHILNLLLDRDEIEWEELSRMISSQYLHVANPRKAILRDISQLSALDAIDVREEEVASGRKFYFRARLEWPSEITETEFFRKVSELPRAKTQRFSMT